MLKTYGLQDSDPRLKPMMMKIQQIEEEHERKGQDVRDPKKWKLNKDDFMK